MLELAVDLIPRELGWERLQEGTNRTQTLGLKQPR